MVKRPAGKVYREDYGDEASDNENEGDTNAGRIRIETVLRDSRQSKLATKVR
jgi:hypothetical protein